MKDEEHQIQKAYFEILAWNEKDFPYLKYIFAIPNGGHRPISVAKKMKAEGVRRGVPDIFIPVGFGLYRYGKWLETKTAKGVMSKEQNEYRNFLLAEGYDYALCRSCDELVRETELYLGITFKNK